MLPTTEWLVVASQASRWFSSLVRLPAACLSICEGRLHSYNSFKDSLSTACWATPRESCSSSVQLTDFKAFPPCVGFREKLFVCGGYTTCIKCMVTFCLCTVCVYQKLFGLPLIGLFIFYQIIDTSTHTQYVC